MTCISRIGGDIEQTIFVDIAHSRSLVFPIISRVLNNAERIDP